MGRGRDFRGGGKGRRPYEEDAVASAASDRHQSRPLPRDSLPTEGTAVDAIVKWFNPDKGFGFAEIADGSGSQRTLVEMIGTTRSRFLAILTTRLVNSWNERDK